MKLEDLMERASRYDETLARDIKDYVHGRKYGLVYEASKPEFVRMWKKPVVRGDLVNILPPRGMLEDTKSEDDPAEVVFKVTGISGNVAKLRNPETGEDTEAAIDDVVALARFDRPIYAGLKEVDRVERGGDKPYNVVINGENYHALQTLVYACQGMVDCIYIDPPYNTGAKDWKYNNNYVGEDDVYRHSKWLTFMEDRLKLAKKLLNPNDSVLIVTVDEKEYLRLGLLLEQMFPGCRVQMISININPAAVSRHTEFGRADEYAYFVFVGAGAPCKVNLGSDWITTKGRTHTGHIRWDLLKRSGTRTQRRDSPGCFYPIYAKDGIIQEIGEAIPLDANKEDVPVPDGLDAIWPIRQNGTEGNWQLQPKNLRALWKQGFVKLGKAQGASATVYYLKPGERAKIENGTYEIIGHDVDGSVITSEADDLINLSMPTTQWRIISHDSTQYGSRLLQKFLGEKRFDFPKSLYAVEDCLRFVVANKPNALIVDFFAGSGTTAHATMRLNHQDGGNRRCISVTNNEVSAQEVKVFTKKGLRQGDDEWEAKGICSYVTRPRIISAITGIDIFGNPIEGNYGIEKEIFVSDEADVVIDKKTGKQSKKKIYEKVKVPNDVIPDQFPISDGFKENAIFFDLEYLEPAVVGADLAFDSIAPILWMCGGCKGEILSRHKGYVIGETYAVLFDPRYTKKFVDVVINMPEVSVVFVVTDIAESYRSLCAELPGRRVMQLYESYLRSFEINAIG